MSPVGDEGASRTLNQHLDDGIAIIGMSCLFPGAQDVDAFWRNILGKVDAVTDPPPEAWDSNVYYDPSFTDQDKVYCQRGGYLGSLVSFDPLSHGIPPVAVGGEPDQWLALQLAHDAMLDAGSLELSADVRQRTEVILGKGTYLNGGNAIAVEHGLVIGQTIEIVRKLNPEMSDDQIELLRSEMKRVLPPMNAETVPGLIPNIIVGRIANRLDFMGPAYTVDAACASSLVAVQHAMRDLRSGDCDLALVGGAQVWMPVPTLNVFCRLGALSKTQRIRPFDEQADGTLLGEGIGMVVLKRLADAERDGDRVYAVIRGIGVSSDGRGVSVMAPRIDGEELALRRAYESSGISPSSIGLIEAHGTATPVGDVVEMQALTRVFGARTDEFPSCAIGTVKSMISHTIPASGVAGLIKSALALHHKVLPPTINCDVPNPKLDIDKTPFYINTEVRPWIHGGSDPRRAGINSFGFGGINAHVILEEYTGASGSTQSQQETQVRGHLPEWDSEVLIFEGSSAQEIADQAERMLQFVEHSTSDRPSFSLADLAATVNARLGSGALRLAVVTTSFPDLAKKLARAVTKLRDPNCKRIKEVSGLYYFSNPLERSGKIALLFPGEGSQYTNMLADLCLHFPEVRERFDRSDRIFKDHPRRMVLSDVLFPRPSFNDEDRRAAERRLMQMDMAIEAVLTTNDAMFSVLTSLGVNPDVVVGHSTGEYSAMAAAGAIRLDTDDEVAAFSHRLNQSYQVETKASGIPQAMMLAIGADRESAQAVAREAGGDVFLAMDNCPHQAVLVGERSAVERAREIAEREQLIFEELAFDRAYHTRLFQPYAQKLRDAFETVEVHVPRTPIYSCTTAAEYPDDPDAIRELMVEHWSRPVEFQHTIEELYDSGVRLFVEAGARGNLSAFVEDILRGREFAAVPANVMRRTGITQLNHLVGLLAAHGVDLNWSYLYRNRMTHPVDLDADHPDSDAITAGRKIDLSTTWPMITISDEVAAQVRTASSTSVVESDSTVPAVTTPFAANHQANTRDTHNVRRFVATDVDLSDADSTFEVELADTDVAVLGVNGGSDDILSSYFETMQDFLDTQSDVMRAYLTGESSLPGAGLHSLEAGPSTFDPAFEPSVQRPRFSFIQQIVSFTPGTELIATCTFDRSIDLFLNDHTLGHSLSGDRKSALAVVPLTLSLEIIAEAAATLLPGTTVVGMERVEANHWLAFDDNPQTVEITASILARESSLARVQVGIRSLSAGQAPGAQEGVAAVQAIVLLADRYPDAPNAQPSLVGGPSRTGPADLYRSIMFHGPMWQGVKSIDVMGDTGAEATLRILNSGNFVANHPDTTFLIDPITLDAAGQVIGFWTSEVLETGRVVFPFRLDRLDIYGERPRSGSDVRCRATITLIGSQLTSSDIDVLDAEGNLWMRLSGWQDKRFDLPEQFEPLMLPDGPRSISDVWTAPVAPYGAQGAIECRSLNSELGADRAFWTQIWAQATLTAEEKVQFQALSMPESRRLEWLAVRSAAKDAVRSLAYQHFGMDLKPADIVIERDDRGSPRVYCPRLESSGFIPIVSLTHSDGMVAAIAGFVDREDSCATAGIGIDVEHIRSLPDGFVDTAFSAHERSWLDQIGIDARDEWILRVWCAKEAIGKAIGTGLVGGPHSLEVRTVDWERGLMTARAAGALASQLADSPGEFLAHTGRDGDLVFATSICDLTNDRG